MINFSIFFLEKIGSPSSSMDTLAENERLRRLLLAANDRCAAAGKLGLAIESKLEAQIEANRSLSSENEALWGRLDTLADANTALISEKLEVEATGNVRLSEPNRGRPKHRSQSFACAPAIDENIDPNRASVGDSSRLKAENSVLRAALQNNATEAAIEKVASKRLRQSMVDRRSRRRRSSSADTDRRRTSSSAVAASGASCGRMAALEHALERERIATAEAAHERAVLSEEVSQSVKPPRFGGDFSLFMCDDDQRPCAHAILLTRSSSCPR